MIHHLTGATIQVANLVNYNCHLQADGNITASVRIKAGTKTHKPEPNFESKICQK